jgi:hypothetical protein
VPETNTPPRIETVTPDAATEDGGATVRLRTTHIPFVAPVRVYFGTSRARIVRGTRLDAVTREIVVVAPAHAPGLVPVRVISGATTPSEREVVLPNAFRYVAALRVDRVEPDTVTVNGDTRVTITGSGFAEGVRVFVGDEPTPALERLSDESLVVTVPARDAGKASLTVVAFAGRPYEQRKVLADALTYATPAYGILCLISTRLVDLTTSEVLDCRLVALNERVEGGAFPRDRLWEYIAGRVAGELPLQLVRPPLDRLGLVTLPDASRAGTDQMRTRAAASLSTALGQTLRGRGVDVVLGAEASGLTTAFDLDTVPFGTLLLRTEDVSVNKAFVARLVALYESDRPSPDDASEFDAAVADYRRIEALASNLPEAATARATMLIRLPEHDGTFLRTDAEVLREDAVMAGVIKRIPVLDKTEPMTTKPPWLMRYPATHTDPLGYTSWAAFQRAHPSVESLFFYKPDSAGLYARLADARSGRIIWSGHLLTAGDVFTDAFDASVHDRARNLADRSDWMRRTSAETLLWVSPATDDPDAETWEGVVSSLVDAGIPVAEPMTTVYRRQDPSNGRVQFAEDPDASDVWFDLARFGVTHVLEYALNRAEKDNWTMTFRLIEVKSGTVDATWRVDENGSAENADASP